MPNFANILPSFNIQNSSPREKLVSRGGGSDAHRSTQPNN